MPVSPAQAEHLAAGVVVHYQDAEAALTARIARNLAKGIDAPEWAATKLAQMQEYERQARRLLADLEKKAASGVATAITDAYERGGLSAVQDIAKLNLPLDATGPYHAERVATLARSKTDKELARELQRYEGRVGLTSGDLQVKAAVEREVARRAAGVTGAVVEPLAGLRAIEALTQETLGNVLATHTGILRSVMDTYRSVIAESSSGVLLGDQTRRQAAQAALNRFVQKGITGFVDSAGRGWSMESYTEMALRTGCGRAAVQGHVDRLTANGLNLVIVSDAPRECPLCRKWEGKVLSIDGASAPAAVTQETSSLGAVNSAHFTWEQAVAQGMPAGEVARAKAALDAAKQNYTSTRGGSQPTKHYPTLDEARAAGLMHCNCRHSVSAYQEGITRPMGDVADPEGYADTTKLRYLERQTRAAKRVQAAAMPGDPAVAQAAGVRVRAYQAKIRAHVASTTAKRQPTRERLGAL